MSYFLHTLHMYEDELNEFIEYENKCELNYNNIITSMNVMKNINSSSFELYRRNLNYGVIGCNAKNEYIRIFLAKNLNIFTSKFYNFIKKYVTVTNDEMLYNLIKNKKLEMKLVVKNIKNKHIT